MKKIALIAATLIIILAVSCSKDRTCRCVSPTSADTIMFSVANSTRCSSIKKMGMENRNTDGTYSNTLHDVNCTDVTE